MNLKQKMIKFTGNGQGFIIPKKSNLDEKARRTSATDNKYSESTSSSSINMSARPTDDKGFVVWTGALHHGDEHVESIDLKSMHRNGVKPSGFSSSLQIQRLLQWKDCLKFPPFVELVSNKTTSNSLLQKQFVILQPTQSQLIKAYYFYLINTFSPMFVKICKRLKDEEHVGIGVFENGTVLMLIPEGSLSHQLGFHSYNGHGAMLHCLFLVQHNELPEPTGQYYPFDAIPHSPALAEKLDGTDVNLLAKLQHYQQTCGLSLAKKKTLKQVDSLFTPSQKPPGGKVLTPYIPTPGYPSYPSSSTSSQSYKQLTSPIVDSNDNVAALHSIIYGPPPPPPPPESKKTIPSENILERQQKNKALLENAFAAVKQIGTRMKVTEKSNTFDVGETSALTKSTSSELIESAIIRELPIEKPTADEKDRVITIPLAKSTLTHDPRLVRDPRRYAARNEYVAAEQKSAATSSIPKSTTSASVTFPPLPIIQKNANESKVETKINMEIEVLDKSAPMEIDESSADRPYSPSQAIVSPEPMETDDNLEEKNTKNRNEQEKGNNSLDSSNSNFDDFAISIIPQVSGESSKTVGASSGFAFNYLGTPDWNVSQGSKDNITDHEKDKPSEKPSLAQFLEAGLIRSSNETNQQNQNANTDLEKQEDDNDKDFRQIWAEVTSNGNEQQSSKQLAIGLQQNSAEESPISPSLKIGSAHASNKSLPSLIHMNILPPLISGIHPTIPQPGINRNPPINPRPVHQVRPIFANPAEGRQRIDNIPAATGQLQYRVIHLDLPPSNFNQPPQNLVINEHFSHFLTDPRLQKHIPNQTAIQQRTVPTSVMIIDPNINSQTLARHFRKLLEIAKRDEIIIKWHTSLTQKLGFDSEREHEYQMLLSAFRDCGVIEMMARHYCDGQQNPHEMSNSNNELICALNLEREMQSKPEWKEVKLIYMTDIANLNSNLFQQLKDKFRIVRPTEFTG